MPDFKATLNKDTVQRYNQSGAGVCTSDTNTPPSTFFGNDPSPNTSIRQTDIISTTLYSKWCTLILLHSRPEDYIQRQYNIHAIHELMMLKYVSIVTWTNELRPITNAVKPFRPFPNCTKFPKIVCFFQLYYVTDTWACINEIYCDMIEILNKLFNIRLGNIKWPIPSVKLIAQINYNY